MGLDFVGFQLVQQCFQQYPQLQNGSVLTLGRQGLHLGLDLINHVSPSPYDESVLSSFIEPLLLKMGAKTVESVDNSKYEGATHVHDMNQFWNVSQKYDLILDGGTIEHIFNIPFVLTNVIQALKVGGVFCSITCNNNYSGHGMYQFSPELFYAAFQPKYGMTVDFMYLAEVNTHSSKWLPLQRMDGHSVRQLAKLDTTNHVYICTIARKLSIQGSSLLHSPPQQYNYEQVDWKQ